MVVYKIIYKCYILLGQRGRRNGGPISSGRTFTITPWTDTIRVCDCVSQIVCKCEDREGKIEREKGIDG